MPRRGGEMVRGCWRGWLCAVPVLVAVGCKDGDDPGVDPGSADDGCTSEDILVTPGTGTDAFIDLAPGDPVTLVHGPQGGWHVESAGWVVHAEPEVSVHPRITVPDQGDLEIVGEQEPSFIALVGYDATTCEGSFYNVRGFVDTNQGSLNDIDFVCSLDGVTLRFEVTVADIVSGRSTTAGVDVVAALDPTDLPYCGAGG